MGRWVEALVKRRYLCDKRERIVVSVMILAVVELASAPYLLIRETVCDRWYVPLCSQLAESVCNALPAVLRLRRFNSHTVPTLNKEPFIGGVGVDVGVTIRNRLRRLISALEGTWICRCFDPLRE